MLSWQATTAHTSHRSGTCHSGGKSAGCGGSIQTEQFDHQNIPKTKALTQPAVCFASIFVPHFAPCCTKEAKPPGKCFLSEGAPLFWSMPSNSTCRRTWSVCDGLALRTNSEKQIFQPSYLPSQSKLPEVKDRCKPTSVKNPEVGACPLPTGCLHYPIHHPTLIPTNTLTSCL